LQVELVTHDRAFTLGAREYHVSSSYVNPAIGEPVSPAERSSAGRSVARAGTVEQRADERKQALTDVVIWRKSDKML
jgi:hypothetical protein